MPTPAARPTKDLQTDMEPDVLLSTLPPGTALPESDVDIELDALKVQDACSAQVPHRMQL